MANKIYIAPETTITWTDTGGDELLDLGGLAAAGVAMGSFADLGAASRSEWYEAELFIDGWDSAPALGETVVLYFSQSNATTNFDGCPTTDPTTTAQGTMTADQIKNLGAPACIATVYSTTPGLNIKARGVIRLTGRYVSPVVQNNSAADALLSTADAHTVKLTPIPPEVQ